MKKWIYAITVTAILIALLSGCNFNTNYSGAPAAMPMEADTMVEQMLTALTGADAEKAKALLHADIAEQSDAAIAQMTEYIAGREVTKLERTSLNIKTTTGTAGKVRQGDASFRVQLSDGAEFYLAVTYVSGTGGKGFTAVQIVLGVV